MTLSAVLRRYVKEFADAAAKMAHDPIQNGPDHDIVWGVIHAINATNKTVTLYVGGASTTYTNAVKYHKSYTPHVGDYVKCQRYDRDLVIVDAMTGSTLGKNDHATWAIAYGLYVGTYPGPFIPVSAGQTTYIIGARFQLLSGGSLTASVAKNGTAISGLNACNVTTTSSSSPILLGTPVSIADGDDFDLTLSSFSGSPSGLKFSLIVAK